MAKTFGEVYVEYTDKFGHTFDYVSASDPVTTRKARRLMKEALAGKRKKVTNNDLNIRVPRGAEL